MKGKETNDMPDFPVFFDVLGGMALVAFIGSEVVSKPITKWALRGVTVLAGGPFLHKTIRYNNDYFEQDLFGLDMPGPGGH